MGRLYRPSLDRISNDTDEYPMPPCTQVDPDLFFDYRTRKVAQKICMGCPFQKACLRSAVNSEQDPGGVYGALTDADRKHLRKRCHPIG